MIRDNYIVCTGIDEMDTISVEHCNVIPET